MNKTYKQLDELVHGALAFIYDIAQPYLPVNAGKIYLFSTGKLRRKKIKPDPPQQNA